MSVTLAAATLAGAAAVAAYADAKFHIRSDLSKGSLDPASPAAQAFSVERFDSRNPRPLLYHDIEAWAKKNQPGHLFLEFEGRKWTYAQFYADLQRIGNWLMNDLQIQAHEMVALNGPNSAEFLLLVFALEAIGARPSYINHNLTGPALHHCITLCEPRVVLADRETTPRIEPGKEDLAKAGGIQVVYYDEQLFTSLVDTTPLPAHRSRDGIQAEDVRSLIYTSGTTGLPKGVMMLTGRTLFTARNMAKYLELKQSDKFYTCLPLYHAAAQGLCVGPVISAGASVCLGRKFSHRHFWPEVAGSGATHLQYVGELCRYLVNGAPHPQERAHQVRVAWGNGMRPDVWERFRQRFGIAEIHELYAATDGMGASFNRNRGAFGRNAIGIRGWLWNRAMRDREIRARIDPDTEEIVRGPDGWIQRCGVDEPGEVLHAVDPELAATAFRGYYKNESSTEKRWMRDVLRKGDLWFRSGDMMRQDAEGRVYFTDRLGETFRWKSENCSTSEIADALGEFPQVAETAVYGVAVPHADGRCGCATLVLAPDVANGPDGLDRVGLAAYMRKRLPRYAVPLFLRVTPALQYTGTFKIQKGTAKREGVDLDLIEQSGSKDRIFWLPPKAESYQPYTRADWEDLKSGKVQL